MNDGQLDRGIQRGVHDAFEFCGCGSIFGFDDEPSLESRRGLHSQHAPLHTVTQRLPGNALPRCGKAGEGLLQHAMLIGIGHQQKLNRCIGSRTRGGQHFGAWLGLERRRVARVRTVHRLAVRDPRSCESPTSLPAGCNSWRVKDSTRSQFLGIRRGHDKKRRLIGNVRGTDDQEHVLAAGIEESLAQLQRLTRYAFDTAGRRRDRQ